MAITSSVCAAQKTGLKMANSVDSAATLKSLTVAEMQLVQEFDKKLYKAALMIDSQAKKNIQGGSRSGRIYKRRSVTHQASAPGEYPKTDTGKLARSIFTERRGLLHYVVGSRGSGAPHGRWLEFGTIHMRARPWLSRAAIEVRSRLKAVFQ
jgi:HK97 gp10 family phage protein